MKKLSIEQKAKRYDEALERAKEINNEQRSQPFNVMTKVFPELAESEDEKIRKELIDFVKSRLAGFPDCKRFTTWLEKQCEQEEPQVYKTEDGEIITYSETDGYKSAEPIWSEEDEKMKDAIYSCVDLHYDGLAKTSLLIWIKSLRPQNTWKPSDEQMNLLEELVEDNNQRHFYTILRSLYEQLKKLKEE